MNIHQFDDTDPLHLLISKSSWFYRFTLTWKGSLEPMGKFGDLKVMFFLYNSSIIYIHIILGGESPLPL